MAERLPCPDVNESTWRSVIFATSPDSSGSRVPIGASRSSLPSSTSVNSSVAVIHFDAEAIGIGRSGSIVPARAR